MCDLWRNTLQETVPAGAIPEQIRRGPTERPPACRIKLYNAGSFFDPKAILPADIREHRRARSTRSSASSWSVIPRSSGTAVFAFRELLDGRLEVAMGLETIHPDVLPRLNKRMTLERFPPGGRRPRRLRNRRCASFVLVGLPFVTPEESRRMGGRSVEFAFDRGASVVSLIPTRAGNGAIDALAARGEFDAPTLGMLEECVARGVDLGRGRVFADLWDSRGLSRLRGLLRRAGGAAPRG